MRLWGHRDEASTHGRVDSSSEKTGAKKVSSYLEKMPQNGPQEAVVEWKDGAPARRYSLALQLNEEAKHSTTTSTSSTSQHHPG